MRNMHRRRLSLPFKTGAKAIGSIGGFPLHRTAMSLSPSPSPSAASAASVASPSGSLAFGQTPLVRALAAGLRGVDRLAPALAARLAVHLFFVPIPATRDARRSPPPPWQLSHLPLHGGRVALLRQRTAEAVDTAAVIRPTRPPVLLVHGWAGNALQMLPLAQAVADAGFEPLLLDLPAHGRSDGWRCTMPQIVAALFAVQRETGPLAAVVAHSMGGVATLHALARGLGAERLVVMAPSSPPAAVLRWFVDVFRLAPGLHQRMHERIERHEGMQLQQFEAAWLGERVAQPVLLVHDRDDRMAPVANSTRLAQALPQATVRLTDGLSHRRVLTDAAVIAATLAHLRPLLHTAAAEASTR